MFIAFLCCCDAMCTATEINGAATMTQRQCELYCTHTATQIPTFCRTETIENVLLALQIHNNNNNNL